MTAIDVVALAQSLVRIDTSGPEAREEPAVTFLARLLSEAGFKVETHAFAPGRPSLLARLHAGQGLPLVLSGHLDTVPVGETAWQRLPFGAELDDRFLHGRGSADMKGGVAALVAAAIDVARSGIAAQPIALVLTAGEEIGCLGAIHLTRLGVLPRAAGVLVAEPTGNRLAVGHRGALWLQANYAGRSAHGSTPHLGHNAIYDAAEGIQRCRGLRFTDHDPLLGTVSLNVGTVSGGLNINSVPDRAGFTIDIRSVVPGSHSWLRDAVAACLAGEANIQTIIDLPAVRANLSDPFVTRVARATLDQTAHEEVGTVPFFTDASILGETCTATSVILGPGEPDMAHQTNERCAVDQIRNAAEVYTRLMAADA